MKIPVPGKVWLAEHGRGLAGPTSLLALGDRGVLLAEDGLREMLQSFFH